MNGVSRSHRFLTLAEACEYADISERKIRAVCRIVRDANGERVSEMELIKHFGTKRDANSIT